jgi:hypothetical protein
VQPKGDLGRVPDVYLTRFEKMPAQFAQIVLLSVWQVSNGSKQKLLSREHAHTRLPHPPCQQTCGRAANNLIGEASVHVHAHAFAACLCGERGPLFTKNLSSQMKVETNGIFV